MKQKFPLRRKTAKRLLAPLKLMPGFPSDPDALKALVNILQEWFDGRDASGLGKSGEVCRVPAKEQLKKVVDEVVLGYDQWRGPAILITTYQSHYWPYRPGGW